MSSSKSTLSHMFNSMSLFKLPTFRHGDRKSHVSKSNHTQPKIGGREFLKFHHKHSNQGSTAARTGNNDTYPSRSNLAPSATVQTLISTESETVNESGPSSGISQPENELLSQIDEELGYSASHILNYWRQKEKENMKNIKFDPSLSYVPHRRYMVDWLSEIGEELRLLQVTVHSAIYLLDKNYAVNDYDPKTWRLRAICCLSLASKYEEAERNMPMVSEMGLAAEIRLTTSMVTNEELRLIKCFNWIISPVTPMHFVGYYIHQGVTFPTDQCQGRVLVNKVTRYMKKYVEFFANLCQQDYSFLRHKSSAIAAASILAARRALCIQPLWRPELERLTHYSISDIKECMTEVWHFYESMFPTHQPLRTSNDPSRSNGKK